MDNTISDALQNRPVVGGQLNSGATEYTTPVAASDKSLSSAGKQVSKLKIPGAVQPPVPPQPVQNPPASPSAPQTSAPQAVAPVITPPITENIPSVQSPQQVNTQTKSAESKDDIMRRTLSEIFSNRTVV